MLDRMTTALDLLRANYNDIIVCGVIMVSAIIVAIGLLKPLLFNRIQNKQIRKAALALSNVAACFATMLVYFLACGYTFENYVITSVALSISCIVTYWLYENTCLRNLIGLVGGIVLRKVLKASIFAITTEDVEAVKKELKKTGAELKSLTKTELKKASAKIKEDNDLKKL